MASFHNSFRVSGINVFHSLPEELRLLSSRWDLISCPLHQDSATGLPENVSKDLVLEGTHVTHFFTDRKSETGDRKRGKIP